MVSTPPTLFASLPFCVISFLCPFAGGQSLAGGEAGSPPGQYPQGLGPLTSDLSPCTPPLHSLVPGGVVLKEWMEREVSCLIQINNYLLGTYCLLPVSFYPQRFYHFLNSLYSLA